MSRKIAYRYRTVLFALLMSCCTALIVSGTIIYLHSESQASFMVLWLGAFMTAWPIVFVVILLIAPIVNKLVDLIVETKTVG